MKRLQTYLLLTLSLIFLGTLPSVADSKAEQWSYPSSNPGLSSFTGNGTSSSPYLIQCAQDLANLAFIVTDANNDVTGKYFKMTSDIYLNDFTVDSNGDITANGDLKQWTPIGEYGKLWDDDFQGIFDGAGHTIYGLYINEPTPRIYVGLFGSTEDAVVKNLTIKNAYIYTGVKDDIDCLVGTLVGRVTNSSFANISVEGCYMHNEGSTTHIAGQGGLIGLTEDNVTLTDCSFNGTISQIALFTVDAGGLLGHYQRKGSYDYITLRLTRCQTKGELKVVNKSKYTDTYLYLGGFVGGMYTDDKHIYINECVNRLNITLEGNDNPWKPYELAACHYAYRVKEVKRSANLGTVTVTSNKIKYVGIYQAAVGSRYVDCVNYGHYTLPENHDNTETEVLVGTNKIYHDENGENLIVWKEAKPTNLGANDQFESNGTELGLDSLNNNTALVTKLNEEAGGNVWGFYDITENGKTYSVPFPIACGGIPTSMYRNDKGQYLISSEADLRMLQNIISNGTTTNGYYLLTQDIDMSASAPLTQMGDEAHPFLGTLDGNGHVISGVTINGHALIGNLSGTVKNLGLVNMKFMGGNAQCAPFAYKAGYSADASILNCYAGGNITLADSTNNNTILAGLVYEATSNKVSIKNCYFRGFLANATNISGQTHYYYGLMGSNQINNSLTLNDCYAHFSYDGLGLGAGLLPTYEGSIPSGSNYRYLCSQFSYDTYGKVESNAKLAACFAGKDGWLTGAYRPVLDSVRHYTLTSYDGQTVYADAIPLDDDSCRNEIFCHQLTTETANDQLLWALPKVAACDAENNVNYLLSCQLYADKPFRFSPPEGTETKGQLHYPLTFSSEDAYAARLMCLPATLHKSSLPEGTELFLMGKPTGDATEGYAACLVACDSVPAGVPFLIHMNNKPTETVDVVLRGDIVTEPQSTDTLNGQELESGIIGTFEDKHIDNGCVSPDFSNVTTEIKYEEDIDLKPFGAYIDADATVSCATGVLLRETSNYIDQTLATYKGREVTVYLSRKLQNGGWNTLCLPFDVSEDELHQRYGNDTRLEKLTGITTNSDGTCTLCFTSATNVEAGKCYLIQPTKAEDFTYQFDDKTLSTDPLSTTLTSTDESYTLSFMGSFARKTIDGNDTSKGTYFTQDNKIYKVAQGRTIVMNGFRCWIETSKANVLAKAKISHSDGTTSIANVVYVGTTENNNRVYDLQGIETTCPDNHHVYIKNGRKQIGAQTR